jgi:hypothetical protein
MLIPIFKTENYNDNDGAYDTVHYYDVEKQIINIKIFSGYTRDISPVIDVNFLNKNQANIKNILVNRIINNEPYIGSGWYLGADRYNFPVTIKNSKNYKGKNAILVEIISKYNNYTYKTDYVAKIKNQEGDVFYISPNCITIDIQLIKEKLFEMEITKLICFAKMRDEKYYF